MYLCFVHCSFIGIGRMQHNQFHYSCYNYHIDSCNHIHYHVHHSHQYYYHLINYY